MIYHPHLHEIALTKDLPHFDVSFQSPGASLSAFIATHAILRNDAPSQRHAPWLMPPDLSTHLVLHFVQPPKGKEYVRLSFVGPRSEAIRIDRKFRKCTIITTFKPGGAHPWLQKLTPELSDRSVDLQALWPDALEPIQAALTHAMRLQNFDNAIKIIENSLLQNFDYQHIAHPLVSQFLQIILAEPSQPRIQQIARELGVTDRHLRNIVKNQTGLSPKKLLRIRRLTHSLQLWTQAAQYGWAAVAAETGYFDQSHMIDEYQAMLGFRPGQIDL